jgi:CMP/dCMP kinase
LKILALNLKQSNKSPVISSQSLVIAIDGPASSGKGTIAKKIADHFSLPHLNTGALYRAVAFLALENNLDLENDIKKILPLIKKINSLDLESSKLHNEEIGKAASSVAKKPEIRQALFNLQKDFINNGIKNNGGAVLDGRDIGTVICPDANYKFFIIASVEERAKRRFKQLSQNQNNQTTYEIILSQLKTRDEQDKNRSTSPLKKADDAVEIDTSNINIEEVFNLVKTYINNSPLNNEKQSIIKN